MRKRSCSNPCRKGARRDNVRAIQSAGVNVDRPDTVLAQIDQQFPESLDRLFELLRFSSVGTDPAHHADCRAAAEWLVDLLRNLGFAAGLRETTGQPLAVGTYVPPGAGEDALHILFYGHYDVQPADPVDLWTSPPFAPKIRESGGKPRIFARGACDDKGQLMTFLEASRGWLAVHGNLPCKITVLIEGDEEGDTTHLDRFLAENADEFPVDAVFICDTEMWDERTPAIITRLRGCIGDEVTIAGPRIDLHSGYYGGPAINPIKVLSRILAGIHDAKGRIAIPGFYDGVKPIPVKLRKQWQGLKFPERKFLGKVGLSIPAGERNFSVLEQMWARPTAEVNGIFGGYRGPGSKTVLPSEATAKITFRLVEGQDPARIRRLFRQFVKARLPKDCTARFENGGGDSHGISVAENTPWITAARRALKEEWGREAVLVGGGFSIPVVESVKNHLNADSLLIGFSHEDDGAHSPNEKYDVESYRRGIRTWTRIIAQLS
jgi:acetylornithine deacetylase/succinyl-diaminopimelate desuccinylase-like protein